MVWPSSLTILTAYMAAHILKYRTHVIISYIICDIIRIMLNIKENSFAAQLSM